MCYCTVFALFYFEYASNFRVQAPGSFYLEGAIYRRVFLRYEFRGLIFGGAYSWMGLFSDFCGIGLHNSDS